MLLYRNRQTVSPAPAIRRHVQWLGMIFFSLWLVACSESPQEQIIGKWRVAETTDGNVLEFYKDGTVTMQEAITGVSVNGDYSFLNDEKLKIELGGILAIAGAGIYTVSFTDDRMSLKSQNADDFTAYQKVE